MIELREKWNGRLNMTASPCFYRWLDESSSLLLGEPRAQASPCFFHFLLLNRSIAEDFVEPLECRLLLNERRLNYLSASRRFQIENGGIELESKHAVPR